MAKKKNTTARDYDVVTLRLEKGVVAHIDGLLDRYENRSTFLRKAIDN